MNGNENGVVPERKKNIDSRNGNAKKRAKKFDKMNGAQKKRNVMDKFEFGNYNRYYGYRIQNGIEDPRLDVLRQHSSLFVNKDVLDVGCNIGHVSYSIARDFFVKSVLAIDIDNELIKVARKNLHYYCNAPSPGVDKLLLNLDIQPAEMPASDDRSPKFPDNISFLHMNFVPYSDEVLSREVPKYDVILCLSVTKWIHLNWGDDGLRRTFRKMFILLRSGGVLVLEAQPFESYLKKKLSARLRENCRKLAFLPRMFDDYLLKEVGFSSNETLSLSHHSIKGFRRPVQLFFKT